MQVQTNNLTKPVNGKEVILNLSLSVIFGLFMNLVIYMCGMNGGTPIITNKLITASLFWGLNGAIVVFNLYLIHRSCKDKKTKIPLIKIYIRKSITDKTSSFKKKEAFPISTEQLTSLLSQCLRSINLIALKMLLPPLHHALLTKQQQIS